MEKVVIKSSAKPLPKFFDTEHKTFLLKHKSIQDDMSWCGVEKHAYRFKTLNRLNAPAYDLAMFIYIELLGKRYPFNRYFVEVTHKYCKNLIASRSTFNRCKQELMDCGMLLEFSGKYTINFMMMPFIYDGSFKSLKSDINSLQ